MTHTIVLGKRKTHGSGERPRLIQWLLPPFLLVVATVAGLSHWSLSRDKSDFTVLNGKALLKASQKIANLWKASGETGELSGYLADGSEDAYIGNGGRAGEVDPWRCADGSGGNECAHAAAVILAEGSLPARVRAARVPVPVPQRALQQRVHAGSLSERVHAVCAAYALTALTNMPTLALWPADRHLPATTFRHLFSAPHAPNSSRSRSSGGEGAEGWGVSGGEGGVWVRDLPVRSDALKAQLASTPQQQVVLRPCRGRPSARSLPPPPHLFLAPHSAAAQPHTPHAPPAHGAAAAAAGAAEGEGEGAGLFLGGQGEAARVAQGRVEVEGCEYERRVEECLGALEPSPLVAALVLKEDVHRLATSTAFYVDPLGPSGCAGCSEESEYSPPMCAMRRIAMTYLADRTVSFTLAAHSPAHVPQIMDYFPPARSPLLLHATQSRIATCHLEEEVEVEEGEGGEKGVGGGEEDVVGGEVVSELFSLSLAAGLVAVSELFSLSLAAGLVAVNSSALEPRFIAAQAARRLPSFRLHVSVCGRHEIRPITKQKWSMFTMVEEKLKLFICTVPKVAANSWLMWLRAMLGQPHPEDPLLALDDDRAGWHMLHVHFTEKQAVRAMTRPDLFRFTFVRNPFSRVLSAYNNKLVITDSPNNKTGPGSREYWNHAFFRLIRAQWEAVKKEDDLVSFHDFVKLVGLVFKERRWHMDRHIALQRDVCALGLIKYDFVGRFESLEEDAKYVVNRFGGDHLDIFNFGVNAHQTRADEKLVKMYDKETYERVKKLYALDLEIPFNNLCSLGGSLPPRGAFPSALPTLPPIPIAACLPSCCAAGGALASAFLFRTSPSTGGATRASGTRYYPSLLSASAGPTSAPCRCLPYAAHRGALVTPAPPRAFLPGARAAHVSATHPSFCHCALAANLANARRRRSSRPAPIAYHTGGRCLRAILHGADPSLACATTLPSPCQAASAPVQLERRHLASLAPSADPHLVVATHVPSPSPRTFPVSGEFPGSLANGLSHPGAALALPESGTLLRRGGFHGPRQVRVLSLAATRLYPCHRRARRRLLPRPSILLLDGPVQEGFDLRERPGGAAIAPMTALVHVMARVAAVPPPGS
ncbi:unnamed protein product [Closterium sp. NIES-64]|nr:unnamed protein product [Closterium sp. NIES-64]